MDFVQLAAQRRDQDMSAKSMRKVNLIPAEFYGEGVENLSLMMDYQTFRRAFIQAGENTVINLEVEGDSKPLKVLVHQVDYHPVSGKMTHVDFINVRMDKEVHTNIPLEFVGESAAVEQMAGTLMTNVTELEVKCLPDKLVHSIEVDISSLEDFHSSIHVRDVKIPEGIEVLTDGDLTVATVAAPRSEEEMDALDEETGPAVEPVEDEGAEASEDSEGESAAE